MMFDLDEEQQKKLSAWLTEVGFHTSLDNDGAIGGALTYEFTPTTLGVIAIVSWRRGDGSLSINLTDFDSW